MKGYIWRIFLYIIWAIGYYIIIKFILILNPNKIILNLSFFIIVISLLIKDYSDIKGERLPTKNFEHCPLSVLTFLLWYPGILGGGILAIIGILAAVDVIVDFTDDFKIIKWKKLLKI